MIKSTLLKPVKQKVTLPASSIKLTGKHAVYSYDPKNPKTTLKGAGELSSSYLGVNESNGGLVIVKRLNPQLRNHHKALQRFYRENRIQSEVFPDDFNSEIIEFYNDILLIRNYIAGYSLKDLMSWRLSRRVNSKFTVNCMLSVADKLAKIHQKGIIHCDIKPENIIVEFQKGRGTICWDNPTVHIIDFGLARLTHEDQNKNGEKLPFSMIYGAPEQMLNIKELINPTTDLFSVGVTFFSLLTKKSPYPETHPLKLMQLQLVKPLARNWRINSNLFAILSKLTSKPLLGKPPHFYTQPELVKLVNESQTKRHITAEELRVDLLQIKK